MYKERIDLVREQIKKSQVDAFFVTNFFNLFYLTGIKTLSPEEREAFLLIIKNNVYFFTDSRYVEDSLLKKLKDLSATFKLIEAGRNITIHLQETAEIESILQLGFEHEDLKRSMTNKKHGA